MKLLIKISMLLCLSLLATEGFSQCRSFTQKKCMPGLLPFIHNGQMNNITLFPGESAQLELTFFAGQHYRIIVCGQEVLGADVYFKVSDEGGEVIYSSKEAETQIWDFNIENTMNLGIEVFVPGDPDTSHDISHNGCVSVVVGFRE